MTIQSEQHQSNSQASLFWQPDTINALTVLCQNEGLNPVRLRRLIDRYIDTKRKPSRQELIDALKHRPRINERAAILSSVTEKLNAFIATLD